MPLRLTQRRARALMSLFRRGEASDWEATLESGEVSAVLADPTFASAFMGVFVERMTCLPASETARWWERIWDAGAGGLRPGIQQSWLHATPIHPETVRFLLDRAVSPHAVCVEYSWLPDSAALRLLHRALRVSETPPFPNPQEETWWALAEKAWIMPGAPVSALVSALRDLVNWVLESAGLHRGVSPGALERCGRLRDQLLRLCPDRWLHANESGGLLAWLRHAPFGRTGHPPLRGDHPWMAWGKALTGGRVPRNQPVRYWDPLAVHEDLLENPYAASRLGSLARWGVLPWHCGQTNVGSPSSPRFEPCTLFRRLREPMPRFSRAAPCADLPEAWWEGLTEAARYGLPPARWQAVAMREWLDVTLDAQLRASELPHKKEGVPVHTATWLRRWDAWALWGQWEKNGVPSEVLEVWRDQMDRFGDLSGPILAQMVERWSSWGALHQLMTPRQEDDRTGAIVHFWNRMVSHDTVRWALLPLMEAERGSERMLTTLAIKTIDSSPLNGVLASMLGPASKSWIRKAGPRLLNEVLRPVNRPLPECVGFLLDVGVPPGASWESWSCGVRGERVLDASLAIAHRLHRAGLAWEAGDAEHRPLWRLLTVPSSDDGRLMRDLLAAGADPMSVNRSQQSNLPLTTNVVLWEEACARLETHRLKEALREPPRLPPRPRF